MRCAYSLNVPVTEHCVLKGKSCSGGKHKESITILVGANIDGSECPFGNNRKVSQPALFQKSEKKLVELTKTVNFG